MSYYIDKTPFLINYNMRREIRHPSNVCRYIFPVVRQMTLHIYNKTKPQSRHSKKLEFLARYKNVQAFGNLRPASYGKVAEIRHFLFESLECRAIFYLAGAGTESSLEIESF